MASAHLTLCILGAARALTTPPASRLSPPERAALGGVGAGWIALGARTFDAANARDAVGALGVATATFEDNIREPAAGFLELTSPLFVLQGVLLLALSANVFASKDAARVSSSIALASGTTLLALALAVVAGAPIESGFEFITDPLFITAAVALKAALACFCAAAERSRLVRSSSRNARRRARRRRTTSSASTRRATRTSRAAPSRSRRRY